MIKNNLIKTISLTIIAMSLTISNSIYANAEDNINVEQMKSEIAKTTDITTNELKFQGETTVKKEFYYEDNYYTSANLADEKLYYFSYSETPHISFYYGLTSKYVYEESRGTGGGDLTLSKDGNVYSYFEFYGDSYNTLHGWIGWNGWYKASDNKWKYFKDGVLQTGWIYDNGKWYYCYSNGEMAHDTTIEGYTLGSSGAWI